MKKKRLDLLLLERFSEQLKSREDARKRILAGLVLVGTDRLTKPGTLVAADAKLELQGRIHPFVGRGGLKLQGALEHFGVDVRGLVALDVGASTGGFTDCLLQNGCRRVYAVDVGYGQLDWSLRKSPDVVVMERVNARYLEPQNFDPPPELIVSDVSFISLTKLLGAMVRVATPAHRSLLLIKPQFELTPNLVGKKGIVRDPVAHQQAVDKIKAAACMHGYQVVGVTDSQITGAKGNKEFIIYLVHQGPAASAQNGKEDG